MKLSSGLVGVTLAASFAVATALPLGAAALSMQQPAAAQNNLIAVQYEQLDKNPSPPMLGSATADIQMRGDIPYYNGHRGYRAHRRGYVEHEGWWFPAEAFRDQSTTGSIRAAPSLSREHVEWCMAHFQTYRPADNTYSPPRGPRRECVSPYQ